MKRSDRLILTCSELCESRIGCDVSDCTHDSRVWHEIHEISGALSELSEIYEAGRVKPVDVRYHLTT